MEPVVCCCCCCCGRFEGAMGEGTESEPAGPWCVGAVKYGCLRASAQEMRLAGSN